METIDGKMDASAMRIAIVVSRWNEYVTRELLAGAIDTLTRHGCADVTVVHVPGTWEMPLAIQTLLEARKPDAVIALGCILQGATSHAQMLANDVSSALMQLQMERDLPLAWGVLTPESQEQAIERSGMKLGNKGREAALAAIEAVSVQRGLRGEG